MSNGNQNDTTALVGASTTLISRTGSVNGLISKSTFIYQPSANNYVIDKVRIGLLSFEGSITFPMISIGSNNPGYDDIIGPILLQSLASIGDTLNIPVTNIYLSPVSPKPIYVNVFTAGRGLKYNFVVQLIGHYL